MSSIPTVRVEHPDLPGQVMVINASDLTPDHKLAPDVVAPAEPDMPPDPVLMTVAQLREEMSARGLPVRRGYTRDDMIAAILAHGAAKQAEQGAQLAGTAVFSLSKITPPQG